MRRSVSVVGQQFLGVVEGSEPLQVLADLGQVAGSSTAGEGLLL